MARRKQSSIRKLLAGLAAVSLLLFLLPSAWTGWLIGLVQIVVPLQDASTTVVDAVGDAMGDAPKPADSGELEQTRLKAAFLSHQTAALSAKIDELESEVSSLTATRNWNAGGTRIGSRGRLIPARVVVGDVLPWHSSQLITTGSLQGIRRGAPVLSNEFSIAAGEELELQGGMAIVLGEVFLGLVEQVGPHVSRVKLLSDPSVQMKVRIGRFVDTGFMLADGYFWMVGRGESGMEIREVQARIVQAGAIEVGDVVLSDPMSESLPSAMTIGNITALIPDRDNPLFVHMAVRPVLEPRAVERVYVFDPQPPATP